MSKSKNGFFAVAAAAARDFFRHRGLNQAAALTLYALIVLAPLAICAAIAAGYLAGEPGEVERLAQDGLFAAFPWLRSLPAESLAGLSLSLRELAAPSLVVLILFSAFFFSSLRDDLAPPSPTSPGGRLSRLGRRILALVAGPILCACLVGLLVFILALGQSAPAFEGAVLARSIRRISMLWAFFGMTCLFFCLYALLLPGRRAMGAAAVLSVALAAAVHVPVWLFAAFRASPGRLPLPDELVIPGGPAGQASGFGALGTILFFIVWTQFAMGIIVFGGHYLRLWEGLRETGTRGAGKKPSSGSAKARQVFEEDIS